jgi:hypothetical protein
MSRTVGAHSLLLDGVGIALTNKDGKVAKTERFLVLTAAALARRINPCWNAMLN